MNQPQSKTGTASPPSAKTQAAPSTSNRATTEVDVAYIDGKAYPNNKNETMLAFMRRHIGPNPVPTLCDAPNLEPSVRPELFGYTSVLVGQSGMGKSTLVNALVPDAGAATREISAALHSGKHTTTHATLYHLDAESELIDSPGLQELGLGHLDRQEIEHAFREFRPYLGQCRFRDCHHDREPDCALTAAVAAGRIDPRRFTVYHRIIGTQRVD